MADSPPIVLVHGLASSSEHGWRPSGWIDLLEEAGREVIPVDLPGHGTARRSTEPSDYADVPAEVAARFADRGPVDAVGFSAGARVLVECATRGLASFRRLALLGVGPTLLDHDPRAGEAFAAALHDDDGSNVGARLFRGLARRAGNDLACLAAFLRRPTSPLTAADLAAVTGEVLIVTGTRDPAGSPEELAAVFPNATGRAVDGVDHFALQSNVRAMDAVFAFLGV